MVKMDEITMRRITPEDVPALSVMSKETFYDTFTGTCTPEDMEDFLEKYYNENTLLLEVIDSGIEFYFGEIGGKPVGYLSFKEEVPEFEIKGKKAFELKRFYISKEYHGKGAAQKMISFFIERAVKEDCDAVFLGVWEFNYRAQKFYSKQGFLLTDHKHDFPIGNTPQTDVYMVKYLKP